MRKQHYLLVIFMLIFAVSPFTAFVGHTTPPVDDGEVLSQFSSPDSTNIARSVASEEENIDSFDVSPASGRWNVTSDNNTDDLVTDSILRMTTINNGTSGSEGFTMDRGMSKTDGKVEYRMAASGGGNQTEYFRDERGDKADFEEGDDEGFHAQSGATFTVSNGVLTVTDSDPSNFMGFGYNIPENISGLIWHTIRMKMKHTGTDPDVIQGRLRITYADNTNEDDSTWDPSDEWEIFTHNIAEDKLFDRFRWIESGQPLVNIIKVEFVEIIGSFDYATNVEGEIENTWDWEEGDDEGWSEQFVGGAGVETIAGGFVNLTVTAASTRIIFNEGGLAIDTSLFDTLIVRINASDATSYIFPTETGATRFGIDMDLDSTLTVLTWDLSSDSDWAETQTNIGFWIDEDDGTLDNGDNFFIDYVLLLGHWADSDSVIGLWDQDDLVPLLNVSCHFTSDNNHSLTSDKAYFTVELLDLDGDIAFMAISDNYTDISDLWTQGKIAYDVLRSKLIVTISADNLTRIDKWTFPGDFTEVSGRIPALFSHGKSPYIFTSTFCQATSWQEMKLGFIKADFKERAWKVVEESSDPQWLEKSWNFAYVDGDIDFDTCNYSLNIPYLDSVSGDLRSISLSGSFPANEFIFVQFMIWAVDADDGELHEMIALGAGHHNDGGVEKTLIYISDGADFQDIIYNEFSAYTGTENPLIRFGINIIEDRSTIQLNLRFFPDEKNETDFTDFVREIDCSSYSDEFVLGTLFWCDIGATEEGMLTVTDFGFVERNIFEDIVEAVIEPLGNFFQQIFVGLFRFVAVIFKGVGDIIGFAVLTMQIALTAAINQIQGWLTTLGTTITGAIANIEVWLTTIAAAITGAIADIEEWLNTIATTISDAIGDIAADIWTKFTEVVSDIVDDIIIELTSLASDVADFIDLLVQFLLPLLLALAEDIATLLVDILEFVLPLLALLAETMVEFFADIVFWIWDALGLPDLLAVADILLTGFIQFITGLPQFVTDWVNFLTAISDLFVVLGFIWIFILPIAIAPTAGDCFEKMLEHAMTSVVADWKIFGVGGRIPIVIPWAILLFWTMLDGTIFFGFF